MKRLLMIGLVLAGAPLLWAQDLQSWGPTTLPFRPFETVDKPLVCAVGGDSRAIALGNGSSAVALYVFDPLGHCVALDDEPVQAVIDDRVVAWRAAMSGQYSVEIRNMGPAQNPVDVAAK